MWCAVMTSTDQHRIKYFRHWFLSGLRSRSNLPPPCLLVVISVDDRVYFGLETDVLTEFEALTVQLEVLEYHLVVHEVWKILRNGEVAGTRKWTAFIK